MTEKQSATIKQVAERAGVSQMTVSRVLNNEDLVKKATRDKVHEAIRELNYRPNIMARKLAGGKGLFIGLIYRNPSYGYLSELLLGALDACRDKGHYLMVDKPFLDEDLMELEYIEKRFLDTSIQAVIVAPPLSENAELIEILKRIGITFVCIGSHGEQQNVSSISMDDKAAADKMTQYLIDQGHTHIGFIQGPDDQSSTHLRCAGFEQAMKRNKLSIQANQIGKGDFTYLSGMNAAKAMLRLDNKPTAIFASNDDMAAGAITAVHQAGLHVPDDISVVGFDDIETASSIWPTLTTVRQPIQEMAKEAIQWIEQRSKGSDRSNDQIILDYEIIKRDSSTQASQ